MLNLVVHIVTTGLLSVNLKVIGIVRRFVRLKAAVANSVPPHPSVRIILPLRTALRALAGQCGHTYDHGHPQLMIL